jgi:hypothetical protein
MNEMSKLVVVRAFLHAHEAHMACSALQAAGLHASLKDANIVAVNWLYSNAVGGVKLLVPIEEVAAAREILDTPAEPDKGDESPTHAEDDEKSVCPRCGSQSLVGVVRGRRLAALSWLLMNVPLFPVWRRTRCMNCGLVRRESVQA